MIYVLALAAAGAHGGKCGVEHSFRFALLNQYDVDDLLAT
jgi:hypothetical protein